MKLFSGDDKGRVVFSSLDLDQVNPQSSYLSMGSPSSRYYCYDQHYYSLPGNVPNLNKALCANSPDDVITIFITNRCTCSHIATFH